MDVKKLTNVFIILSILISCTSNLYSQIGGNHTYEFLNLSNSARIAALGGNYLTIRDNDIALAPSNPSLITPEMHNNLALSFVDYFEKVNYGFVSYGRDFNKLGTYVATIQYIDYGTFKWADETDQVYGEFKANEVALNIGWGRSLDSNFAIGANFKAIYSSLESYNSFGIAVDVAGTYYSPKLDLTASLIARNIGVQLVSYYTGNSESLPFELQMGVSKRLRHVPFRYSILITHLEKWDLTYTDPRLDRGNDFGEGEREKSGMADFADKAMRHIILGGELYIGKNISLRIGYNYRRRQELKVDSKVSTVGFSWGIGFRISKFHFSYSRSTYHLVGSPNYITLTTNLSEFIKKR